MSEQKKPTREEAEEVYLTELAGRHSLNRKWLAVGAEDRAALDAVAKLFGGYAPSVVEVPEVFAEGRFLSYRHENAGSVAVDAAVCAAVAARSRAWEEVKGLIECQFQFLDGRKSESWAETTIKPKLAEIVQLMSRPEMGVGPKAKP